MNAQSVKQDSPAGAILPQPVSVVPGKGTFTLTRRTVISTDQASAAVGRQLAQYFEPATGFDLRIQAAGGAAPASWDFCAQARFRPEAARSRGVSARRSSQSRVDQGTGACRPLLRCSNLAAAPSERHFPSACRRLARCACRQHRVACAGGFHRGLSAVPVARRASRRRSSLHAEGVRQEVHRPSRASQDEHLSLAPDRRPGMADRDQAVSEADRGRRLAEGDARRPHRDRIRRRARSTASATAVSTRRTTRAKSLPTPRRAS